MKKEFVDYINSFNKEPGYFTEDEIYDIGVAHKKLLREEKCWDDVAELVGWNGTGEQLRSHINSRMKKDGTLPTNKNVISEKSLDCINGDELESIKNDLMKERQRTRDEWNAYRRFLREDARLDELKDSIRDTVSLLNKLPNVHCDVKYDTKTNDNAKGKEAILLVSDMHIGVCCNNFYNTYNTDIAIKRVKKLTQDTIDYCKSMKVTKLNVVNLGDLIHGIIHTNARVEQEIDVVEQVMQASEIMAMMLNELQRAVPTIIYRSVIDNHSRMMSNKEESIESENLGRLIDWYLEERLKGTNVEFAYDNLDDGIGKFNLSNGKLVMFAHGHNDNINHAFQHFVGATEEFVHYILLGHYHCEKAKSYQGSKVIVNGSIVGTEQYALGKRLFSKPSQTLLVFDNDNMIDVSINLDINK